MEVGEERWEEGQQSQKRAWAAEPWIDEARRAAGKAEAQTRLTREARRLGEVRAWVVEAMFEEAVIEAPAVEGVRKKRQPWQRA